MAKYFNKRFFIVLAILFSNAAQALQWICTPNNLIVGINKVNTGSMLSEEQIAAATVGTLQANNNRKYNYKINTRLAAQVYSGDQILVGTRWLNGCMMRSFDPLTKEAFSYLSMYGVATPETSEKFAKMPGIFDRTVKLVSNDQDMIYCVENNPPAIGYVNFFGGGNVVPCN